MLTYPAYTIEKIENELTIIDIGNLMQCSQKNPPLWLSINSMLKGLSK